MSHQESTAPTAANIAAELRRIADALQAVHPDTRLYANLTLSNRSADKLDDAAKMGLVDALLMAIAGRPGKRGDKFNDGIHYGDQLVGTGPMSLSVYCMVADPAEVSEVERLRAELAEAKADLAARDSRPQMAMEAEAAGSTRELVLETKDQENKTPVIGGAMLTPLIDEDYWLYRVRLSETQAIVGFPKFNTVGIGFAQEEDWNTNLPYTCKTEEIYEHIKHNKADDTIAREDCLDAIALVQEAARSAS
ncbi:MAG: hypothetical protein V4515_15125 [Chloroflexota bacterium]